jgi:hypothetical protein
MMLGESTKIDLFGGGPPGSELLVDVNDPSVVLVSEAWVKQSGNLFTYELTALKTGNAMLAARAFDICPTLAARRRDQAGVESGWAFENR